MRAATAGTDWEHLTEMMGALVKLIGGRDVNPVCVGILHFYNISNMQGLKDLAAVAKKLEAFAIRNLDAPGWNDNAAAVLSFAMETLCEKMKTRTDGPEFASSLEEIAAYLDFFSDDVDSQGDMFVEKAESDHSDSHVPVPPKVPPEDPAGDFDATAEAAAYFGSSPVSPEVHPAVTGANCSDGMQNGEAGMPGGDEPESRSRAIEEAYTPDAEMEQVHEEPPGAVAASVETAGQTMEHKAAAVEGRSPLPSPAGPAGLEAGYRELLKHDPRSQIFALLAEALCFQGRWTEAADTCRQGLVFHPYHLRGRVLLGWALWELGRAEEAAEVLSDAAGEMEKNAVLYRILARITETGDPVRSARYMELYRRLEPAGKAGRLMADVRTSAPVTRVEGSAPINFASELLRRFQSKVPRTVGGAGLFSDRDRQRLASILKDLVHRHSNPVYCSDDKSRVS